MSVAIRAATAAGRVTPAASACATVGDGAALVISQLCLPSVTWSMTLSRPGTRRRAWALTASASRWAAAGSVRPRSSRRSAPRCLPSAVDTVCHVPSRPARPASSRVYLPPMVSVTAARPSQPMMQLAF